MKISLSLALGIALFCGVLSVKAKVVYINFLTTNVLSQIDNKVVKTGSFLGLGGVNPKIPYKITAYFVQENDVEKAKIGAELENLNICSAFKVPANKAADTVNYDQHSIVFEDTYATKADSIRAYLGIPDDKYSVQKGSLWPLLERMSKDQKEMVYSTVAHFAAYGSTLDIDTPVFLEMINLIVATMDKVPDFTGTIIGILQKVHSFVFTTKQAIEESTATFKDFASGISTIV